MNKKTPQELEEPVALRAGIDELNLAELPIASLGRRDRKSRQVLECCVRVRIDDEYHLSRWTVSASAKFGLPTDLAERVLVVLMAMTHDQGYTNPERKVRFRYRQIINTLGLSRGSYSIRRIKKALRQLAGVTITSDLAFREAHTGLRKREEEGGFGLFRYKVTERDGKLTEAWIQWEPELWANFQAEGGIKYLDLDFYLSLQSPIARRLYRILTKRFYVARNQATAYHEEGIFQFTSRVGLSRYDRPARAFAKLQPGIEELIDRGFLLRAELVTRQHSGKQYKRIKLTKHPEYKTGLEQAQAAAAAEKSAIREIDPAQRHQSEIEQTLERYATFGTTEAELKLWQEVTTTLRGKVTKATFDLVFPNSMLLSLQNNTAMIGLHNSIAQQWAENRLYPVVSESLQAHLDIEPASLVFITL